MIQNYSENCDYLRALFVLPSTVSLYELVNQATQYIKNNEEKKLVSENINKPEVEPISKEKKRGRPKRQNSNRRT